MDIEEDSEYTRGCFLIPEDKKEGIISWGLGILLFLLMIEDEEESYHFLHNIDFDETKHQNNIFDMNTFYQNDFGNYLNYYSNTRKSIYDRIA
jgi:hypothetical protein